MNVVEVMRQAVQAFRPSSHNQEHALQAARQAAERFIAGLGLGSAGMNQDELQSAALKVWTAYCQEALAMPFVVISVGREDVQTLGATGEQLAVLSDEDMHTIARLMEKAYVVRGGFWQHLQEAVNQVLKEKQLPVLSGEAYESREEEE